jgi:hypothetical protein
MEGGSLFYGFVLGCVLRDFLMRSFAAGRQQQ